MSSGLLVEAVYPWLAKKDNHLTFSKGDIITIREQQEIWWSGELHGKVGHAADYFVSPLSTYYTNGLTFHLCYLFFYFSFFLY